MRQDGTGTLEGQLGEGRGSHAQRGNGGDPREGRRSEGHAASVPLAHLGPREPAEVPSLICPPGPLQPPGPVGVGGREGGGKVKAGWTGLVPLRGGWGRDGVPTTRRAHPQLGDEQGWGRPSEERRNRRECGECFPCPPGPQKAC